MAAEPTIPTSLAPLLIAAVLALAGVIAYLFRYYSKRAEDHGKESEAWGKEREAWAAERARLERFHVELRAEYEAKYHETLNTLYKEARENEATARREYAENMESVAQKAAEASSKVAAVMDKIYDYLIRPRRPPH
jgi:flagellar basal body-associated protein FliL